MARPSHGGALGLEAARRPSGVLISGDMVLPRISTNVMVIDLEFGTNDLQAVVREQAPSSTQMDRSVAIFRP